jgi:hydrogenase expression/formation protein HypE
LNEFSSYGKIPPDFMQRVVYPRLGAKRANILVGPAPGLDNCIVNVGGGQVLVASTDPLTYVPEIGPENSAWLSVHLVASDVATSGFQPQYAIFDFNLPSSIGSDEFERYWSALSDECQQLGIAIISGHTGRFEGIHSTIIGGGTILSFGSSSSFLTPAGGKEGDDVIVTKGAAIETTGYLSSIFPKKVAERIGEDGLMIARNYLKRISVVNDALTVTKVGIRAGGISAMHDATEGGVLSAVYELARASSLSSVTREICDLFKIDPYICLSEGTLVFSCNPSRAGQAVASLGSVGIEAAIVGQLSRVEEGILLEDGGEVSSVSFPVNDPYWKAYYDAKKRGWS